MMQIESATAVVRESERGACCATMERHQPRASTPRYEEEPLGRSEEGHHDHHESPHPAASLNPTAFMATVHCLTGCTIGEILGMVIGTALGWGNWPTVALAVALAFLVGYGLTLWPLRRSGMAWGAALGLALASDTLSMATMEFVDNAVMLIIPGAMEAGLADGVFWGSLILSLIVAGAAAFPVNRWLIARGKGHALVHSHHCH